MAARDLVWTDLLDPDRAELAARVPHVLHPTALEQLLAPTRHDDEPRPSIESHGDYVFGVFLVAVSAPEEDSVYYQEVDVVLTRETVITVRKTPPGRDAYDTALVHEACVASGAHTPGLIAYHLVDDVAERYLDLIDAIDEEIEELEDNVDVWPSDRVRARIGGLRHDLLHIRRTLAPTRDALRKVVDNRVDLEEELFDRNVEIAFGNAYDKLLRATEGLELARDLIAGVRDFHQSKIANDQNEVMKRLTAIASLLLLPTFIVGLYGQNFHNMPELGWGFGYWWSWGLIVVTTFLQLWFFRRKRWL